MTETLTPDDLLRLRMRALGLTGTGLAGVPEDAPGAERITAVARGMLATQGQDWRSSRWALGRRAPGTSAADVSAAFNERRIVRSWPMRGTIHVVAAEDIGWMQRATNHRVLGGAAARREFLGIDDATLERLVAVSMAALAGSQGLTRDELAEVWTEAGIAWQGAWRYHLIWWICQNGLATFGPVRGEAEPLLVAAETWIEHPRTLDGDDALVELAARYAAGRGPIRDHDLAWWTGLTVGEARRATGLAAEAGRLQRVGLRDTDGTVIAGPAGQLWADPEILGALPAGGRDGTVGMDGTGGTDHIDETGGAGSSRGADATAGAGPSDIPGWLLLPSFDEHLLGYTNRDAQMRPEDFDRIVPGRNGMFLATVVRRGRVVGTWKRAAGKRVRIALAPMPKCRINRRALSPELARWARFHGHDGAEFIAD
ncbi:winged helix DNA-binding domain-containing protein [Leucobacter zeae]|nr:winged helix DNA-binding domain-containing protein [Leucobacter zeae]